MHMQQNVSLHYKLKASSICDRSNQSYLQARARPTYSYRESADECACLLLELAFTASGHYVRHASTK